VADAEIVAEEIRGHGRRATVVTGDLALPDMPRQVAIQASEALGGLNVLVNCASVFEPDDVRSLTIEGWTRHVNINLRAPVFLAQAFVAQLPTGVAGNIINLVDQRVLKLNPTFFSYTISKSALWTATRTMAQAYAPQVRVNAVGPGPTLASSRMDEASFMRQASLTPLRRGTTPHEICEAIHFILAQPALTGQMIVLDGGQHLAWETPDITEVKE
jgi:NAD(P)-dependent dehydrogenase (short-subunit alcohol dehydrogenase family)